MADENNTNNNANENANPWDKHIDQALEAQDGKTDTTTAIDDNKASEGDQSQQQPKDSDSGTGDDKSQPNVKDETGEKDKKPVAGPKDLTTPEGIVRAGPERRFYEGRELARQQFANEQRAHQQTRSELEKVKQQLDTANQSISSVHGVAPDQLALGVRLVSDLQRDPQGTIRRLLTEAASQGINIEGVGAGVDMAAIQRMIDERIPKADTNNKTDEQIQQESIAEANAFFLRHPDAKPHDELLANVMRDHPDLDLEGAYYQIKQAFIDKGFDWSLSLQDNLKALNESADPAKQQQQQQGNKAPLPNGGNTPNADEFKLADKTVEAGDDMDMGDIVRAAMKENGMNV